MTDELRNCIICGKEYKPHRYDQVTCGNKVCCRKSRIEQDYIRRRQKRAMERERKKHGKGNNDEVIDITNIASKEGLSYGQYVAKYGI